MNILLLGGPKFLGRHIIDAALSRGHDLTIFNRGKTNPDLYPQIEKLRGDRDGDLGALRGRTWDAAVDTCGYLPRVVAASAELLQDAVPHYTFISSISVYAQFRSPGMDESAPVGVLQGDTEEITGETYGPLKVLCEQAVEKSFPGRAFNVRAGLIVGPHDPTDRFTYWPARLARGGEVLAPGESGSPVQLIDGRDLADWIVRMAEARQPGTFNATGPEEPLSMGSFLQACRDAAGSEAAFTWLPAGFLQEQQVAPWSELPMWIPETDPDAAGFATVNCRKAITAGLAFRPLMNTLQDTLSWAQSRPSDWQWRAGLTAEREAEVLRAWHAQSSSQSRKE